MSPSKPSTSQVHSLAVRGSWLAICLIVGVTSLELMVHRIISDWHPAFATIEPTLLLRTTPDVITLRDGKTTTTNISLSREGQPASIIALAFTLPSGVIAGVTSKDQNCSDSLHVEQKNRLLSVSCIPGADQLGSTSSLITLSLSGITSEDTQLVLLPTSSAKSATGRSFPLALTPTSIISR